MLLIVTALNLRPAVTSVGAILADIVDHTGMSPALSPVLVAAPLACFAAGGFLAWPLQAWLGSQRTIALALATLAAALVWRTADGPVVMLAGTVVACLSIAVLSTLIPGVVRAAPAGRSTALMACYTTSMGAGSGLGAFLTPYLSAALSWRLGAASWGLLALASCLAWTAFGRRIAPPEQRTGPRPRVNPFRLTPGPTAWAVTVHLGMVAGFTFTCMGWLRRIFATAGVSAETTGYLFTIAMALGVGIAPFVPKLAQRPSAQSALTVLFAGPAIVAVVGLLLDPGHAPWRWAVLFGVSMVAIVPALAFIVLRTADPATTNALSSLAHGVGFTIAALLSAAAGLLHTMTGSWTAPLCMILGVLCVQLVTGIFAGLPKTITAH